MFDLLILFVEGAMAPRHTERDIRRDDALAVLAFVDRDASPYAWDHGPVAVVRDSHWVYAFEPHSNPRAARQYGVELWPTYVVTRDGREVWRTHDPVSLAEGLGVVL